MRKTDVTNGERNISSANSSTQPQLFETSLTEPASNQKSSFVWQSPPCGASPPATEASRVIRNVEMIPRKNSDQSTLLTVTSFDQTSASTDSRSAGSTETVDVNSTSAKQRMADAHRRDLENKMAAAQAYRAYNCLGSDLEQEVGRVNMSPELKVTTSSVIKSTESGKRPADNVEKQPTNAFITSAGQGAKQNLQSNMHIRKTTDDGQLAGIQFTPAMQSRQQEVMRSVPVVATASQPASSNQSTLHVAVNQSKPSATVNQSTLQTAAPNQSAKLMLTPTKTLPASTQSMQPAVAQTVTPAGRTPSTAVNQTKSSPTVSQSTSAINQSSPSVIMNQSTLLATVSATRSTASTSTITSPSSTPAIKSVPLSKSTAMTSRVQLVSDRLLHTKDAKTPAAKGAMPNLGKSLDSSGIIRKQLIHLESTFLHPPAKSPEPVSPARSPRPLRRPKAIFRKAQTIDITGLNVDPELAMMLMSRKERSASDDEDDSGKFVSKTSPILGSVDLYVM